MQSHFFHTVRATVIGLALLIDPRRATPMAEGCTGFSEEQRDRRVDVWWSIRICDDSRGRELQMRLRNPRRTTRYFSVRLFNQAITGCRTPMTPVARITVRLAQQSAVLFPVNTSETPAAKLWICFDPEK